MIKIAVVGSGISGLGASYYLGKRHHVDLYESDTRIGGHTHTHKIQLEKEINVDSGFIVFNDLNYPNLIQFFNDLGVETANTDMSFSVSSKNSTWSSNEFKKLSTFLKPAKLIFLKNIIKFNHAAKENIAGISFREWLENKNLKKDFVNDYVLPMAAAIWSTPMDKIGEYPVESMLAFLKNHGLLKLINRPQWRFVKNGSASYIDAIIQTSNINNVFTGESPIINKSNQQWQLKTSNHELDYDQVVIATHINDVPKLLANYKDFSFMSDFSYNTNKTILHTDESLMPVSKKLWSSWNSFKYDDYEYVTYWMNNLQNIKSKTNFFVTIGNFPQIKTQNILKVMQYEHPLFDFTSQEVKDKVNELQGLDNLYFAGAYQGYGFHEDGLTSALNVVSMIDHAI
jgi:predicted NAD/FAD-binding protein